MDTITRRWFNVEWAYEGKISHVYDVEENSYGHIRWQCTDDNKSPEEWGEWYPKKDMIEDFIYLIEHLWVIQNKCVCDAQQLLWIGHETECPHYKKL